MFTLKHDTYLVQLLPDTWYAIDSATHLAARVNLAFLLLGTPMLSEIIAHIATCGGGLGCGVDGTPLVNGGYGGGDGGGGGDRSTELSTKRTVLVSVSFDVGTVPGVSSVSCCFWRPLFTKTCAHEWCCPAYLSIICLSVCLPVCMMLLVS